MNRRIVMPGDPDWDKPLADRVSPPVSAKLPDEVVEKVFQEVVEEVKVTADTTPEQLPATVQIVSPEKMAEIKAGQAAEKPAPSYRFHNPAKKRFFEIPVPKPIDAELLEDLPRVWERKCYVGGVEYVTVEGQSFKQRVRKPGFRKGDHVTIVGMTFFMGQGALYTFKEGSRGGYALRPDQVQFEIPKPDPNPETPREEQSNDTATGRQTD